THQVRLTLSGPTTPLLRQTLAVPFVGTHLITIGYSAAGGNNLTPKLYFDGVEFAAGTSVEAGSSVSLKVDHLQPGIPNCEVIDNEPDHVVDDDPEDLRCHAYSRVAGQPLAVGIGAGQISDKTLLTAQAHLNAVAESPATGGEPYAEQLLGYIAMRFFHDY